MFRFFVRDIFWLTLVVALTLGWFSAASKAGRFERQYRELRCDVQWCPPTARIVFDENDNYRLEWRTPHTANSASNRYSRWQ